MLDLAADCDIINKSGAFFSYQDQRLAQGRDNARLYLKDHPELTKEIDQKLRAELFAAKENSVDDQAALAAQEDEEEDDLALLEEDLGEE